MDQQLRVSIPPKNLSRITTLEDNRLAFENFTLQTPDYEKVIVENLSVSVPLGESLLIIGPSGRGPLGRRRGPGA